MDTFNLKEVVYFPTRSNANTSTLIDPIFVETSMFNNITVKPFINGLSNHDAQIICLQNKRLRFHPRDTNRKIRLINDQTVNYFRTSLKGETRDSMLNATCVNEMFNKFQDTFLNHFEGSFPISLAKDKTIDNNWITRGIKISCSKKRELYLEQQNNKDSSPAREYYRKYCRVLRKVINEAKKQHFHNKISTSSNKIKATWKIIKYYTGEPQIHERITKIMYEGRAVTNTNEIANAFNQFYINSATNTNSGENDPYKASMLLRNNKRDTLEEMKIIPITETEIKLTIKALKAKNTTGYDGIYSIILKHGADLISKPLTHICNTSLNSGVFPDRCKFATIRPIYKKVTRKK